VVVMRSGKLVEIFHNKGLNAETLVMAAAGITSH
jgi:hypothetical protein